MDLTSINLAIDELYAAALSNPQRIFPYEIAPNITLQVDTYVTTNGNGFRVVCRILDTDAKTITFCVRNNGPDVSSEQGWTTYNLPNY